MAAGGTDISSPQVTFQKEPAGQHPLQANVQKKAVRLFFSGDTVWKTIYREDGWNPYLAQQRLGYVAEMIRDVGIRPDGKALDLGCGCGAYSKYLLDQGFCVVACDSSEEMLTEAKNRVGEARNSFTATLGDAECLPFADGTFHLVLCIGVLGYLRSDQPAVNEIFRVLRTGGYLILAVRNSAKFRRLPRIFAGRILRRLRLLPPRRQQGGPIAVQQYRMMWRSFIPWELDRVLARAGFRKVASLSHGFGSALLIRRNPGMAQRISSCVDRLIHAVRPPLLDSMGTVYIVAVQKPPGQMRTRTRRSSMRQGPLSSIVVRGGPPRGSP